MSSSGFKEELLGTIKDNAQWAKRNYWYANSVFFLSILSSFFSSIAVALYPDSKITIFAAALPGTILVVNNIFRFEERTKWFWKKVRLAELYYRIIRDSEQYNLTELSAKYSEEVLLLENEWPDFGKLPNPAQKK